MSQNREKKQFRRRWPEWLLPAFFLPSWLMSLGFHMIVFVGVALFFQRAGDIEGNSDIGRVVDIYVKDAQDSTDDQQEPNDSELSTEEQTFDESATEVVQQEALVEEFLDEPLPLDDIFAAGPPGEAPEFPSAQEFRPMPKRSPAAARASGPGETSFMSIKDKGTRFVFIIDCSGSMHSHNAIRVAKDELKNSISLLESTQQFQVIYYNNNAFPWRRRGRSQDIYWANDTNKQLAYQFINERSPAGGTDHRPALMMGLSLQPEVIYFLTDADHDDRLSAGDMSAITQTNGGRTRIHCIEFGVGPKQEWDDNYLVELARRNGGSYRYRNVKDFSNDAR